MGLPVQQLFFVFYSFIQFQFIKQHERKAHAIMSCISHYFKRLWLLGGAYCTVEKIAIINDNKKKNTYPFLPMSSFALQPRWCHAKHNTQNIHLLKMSQIHFHHHTRSTYQFINSSVGVTRVSHQGKNEDYML